MTKFLDQNILSHFGGLEINSLTNIIENDTEYNVQTNIQHSSYYDFSEFNKLASVKKTNFSVLSANIQSVFAKFEQLEALVEELHTINFKFTVICLQECWLANSCDASILNLPGYNCIAQGKHSSERGGLMMYIDDRFQYSTRLNINMYEHWEGQVVCLKGGGLPIEIIIGNIYRPPRMLREQILQFINEFASVIQSLKNNNKHIVIAGDFNLNLLKINQNELCSDFLDLLMTYGMYPQITLPTRLTDKSVTLIDNLFCNFDKITKRTTAGILLNELSDHQPYFLLSYIELIKTPVPKFIKAFTLNENMVENIKNELLTSDLLNQLDPNLTTNPNETYNIIHEAIETAKHKHMPSKLVKFNKYRHKKSNWITKGLLKSIRFRDNLYKKMKLTDPISRDYEVMRINLKTYNRILKASLRAAKQHYFAFTFAKYKSDIKNTWKTINEALSGNRPSEKQSLPISLTIENTEITKDLDIANQFNTFFINIGANLAKNIEYQGIKNHNHYLTETYNNAFEFTEIDDMTVKKVIDSLQAKNSSGFDGYSTKFLKYITPAIIKPLTLLTQQVLTTGIFPDKLKLAKVIPIYKKGEQALINNYRPISLLPVISKVLEKILANQISSFFERNELFSINQYGFRAAHCTEHAAIELTDRIITKMDNNEIPIGIFLDLSKAFDTINHKILLSKLKYYGISGVPLQLLDNYLTNRSQYVVIKNIKSNTLQITTGVPQGSILGPLLFLIYINDFKI